MSLKQMTKAERRVVIAKDALAQLKKEKYRVETGNFVGATVTDCYEFAGEQLDKVLPKLGECKVCALGAILLSTVRKEDNFELTDDMIDVHDLKIDGEAVVNRLKTLFSVEQLALIENAFEMGDGWFTAGSGSDIVEPPVHKMDKAAQMYLEDHDEDARLEAILTNIIKNKGTFVLS